MSALDAGNYIRYVRKKAGLTQEQLSEGICTPLALSQFENGKIGMSSATFQALLHKAGVTGYAYPMFSDKEDFECFYALKRIQYYLDSWQLSLASDSLDQIDTDQLNQNPFYYQEWLLYHVNLQLKSGMKDYDKLIDVLKHGLKITQPEIDFFDIRSLLPTANELYLLCMLCYTKAHKGFTESAFPLCSQILTHLEHCTFSSLDHSRLCAWVTFTYSFVLYSMHDYSECIRISEQQIDVLAAQHLSMMLPEFYFINAMAHHQLGNNEVAKKMFQVALYSSYGMEYDLTKIILDYIVQQNIMAMPEEMTHCLSDKLFIRSIPGQLFQQPIFTSSTVLSNHSAGAFPFGNIIQYYRMQQGISQDAICHNIFSVSKMSKLENDQLQPDPAQAEVLLQRLGFSDNYFDFYAKKQVASIQEKINNATHLLRKNPDQIQQAMDELMKCTPENDILTKQYIIYKSSQIVNDPAKRIELLLSAIHMTTPSFSFYELNKHRFSWCEVNILNHLCEAYYYDNPAKGISYFMMLLDYLEQPHFDILEKKLLEPLVLSMMVWKLCESKRYEDILPFSDRFISVTTKSYILTVCTLYEHYAEALMEVRQDAEQAVLYARCAYYMRLLFKQPDLADNLQTLFRERYQTEII